MKHVILPEYEESIYYAAASMLSIQAHYFLKNYENSTQLLLQISKGAQLKTVALLKISTLFIELLQKNYSQKLFERAKEFFTRLEESDFSNYLKMRLLGFELKKAYSMSTLDEMKQLSLKIKSIDTQAKALLLLIHHTDNMEKTIYRSKLLDEKYSHTKSYQLLNIDLGNQALQMGKESLKANRKRKAKMELIEAEKRLSIAKKMESEPQKILKLEKSLQECLHHLYEANE